MVVSAGAACRMRPGIIGSDLAESDVPTSSLCQASRVAAVRQPSTRLAHARGLDGKLPIPLSLPVGLVLFGPGVPR